MKKVLSVALASAMVLGMGATLSPFPTALAPIRKQTGRITSSSMVSCL